MKILHTSDWHLGRSLYGKKRYEEFEKFLEWLENTIIENNIDALIIAGDVFDNSTPGNRAQHLYYSFLCRVSLSCCRHIVVVAGNHDSPSFLDAPREILKALNVHVIGNVSDNPSDEIIILHNDDKNPEAIICAVPYLRDRDIRTVESGESLEDKNIKLIEGIKKHYREVSDAAEAEQEEIAKKGFDRIPVIATGHLFTAGGKTVDGDGVRELYVGSLAHVAKDLFPENIDYMALGHLHVPQKVSGDDFTRYSGSPIPMGYGEANQEKKVVIVDFNNDKKEVAEKIIPCFQQLIRITGDTQQILEKIDQLRFEKSSAWLEIEYTGNDASGNLREIFDEAVSNTDMEIRRIKNNLAMKKIINSFENEVLDDLNEQEIFRRCLDSSDIPEEERNDLLSAYSEILNAINDEDSNAE